MLDFTYKPSSQPVVITAGPDMGEYQLHESWAAGLTAKNCFTAMCGQTWVTVAPERGGDNGHFQLVFDHVETWAEALAIWRKLDNPNIKRVRCLPSEKLLNLPKIILGQVKRAMAREGWLVETGPEWILTRLAVADGE